MIECAENNNVTYYCAPANKVSFEEVFKSINDTIEYNMDLERKVQLFREKVNELQTIFAEEDIDVLKTITFKYKKPKKRNHKVENVNETFDETITETNDVSEDNNLNLMDNDQNENKLTFVEEIER